MINLKLGHFDIFKGEGELFLSSGDHYLLRITGEDCTVLETIIKEFKQTSKIDSVYASVKSHIEADKFNNLVNWLAQNRILVQEDDPASALPLKSRNVTVWGNFADDTQLNEKIFGKIGTATNHYELKALVHSNIEEEMIIDSDLVLIFSPIFSNYNAYLKINEVCYKHKIPALHIGVGMNFFTIGPFSSPSDNTPCLKCYAKRKMVNLDSKDKYLKFVKLNNQKLIQNNDIFQNPNVGLMAEFLKIELEKYFTNRSVYLHGRSITVDMLDYHITESKVLRVPYCEICDETSAISPLN